MEQRDDVQAPMHPPVNLRDVISVASNGGDPQSKDDAVERNQAGASGPEPEADYKVGYGKPPLHTRFHKGQSGNPSGRPAGVTRVKDVMWEEAFRMVRIDENGAVMELPAIQAVLRSQFALALKGNSPAQRAFIKSAVEADEERRKKADEEDRKSTPVDRPIGHVLLAPAIEAWGKAAAEGREETRQRIARRRALLLAEREPAGCQPESNGSTDPQPA